MQFSALCGALHVLQGLPTSVAAHPAAAAAEQPVVGPVSSWHLRVRYRSRALGLKSTVGKCPVDF